MPNPNVDLEAVIEDSITDSQLPADTDTETPELETSDDDSGSYQVAAPSGDAGDEPAAEDGESRISVPASEAKTPAVKDEFERIAGMPAVGAMGRENRIPYSRVKKITEKAVAEVAEAALGRKLNAGEKPAEVVKSYIAETSAKVTDYEARLEQVGRFEDVIENQPKQFIQMLEKLPQYKEFFDYVRAAVNTHEAQGSPQVAQQGTSQAVGAALNSDAMPEPDQELEDGTKVYSLDGLKALLSWNSQDTERRVIKQVESQYAPIRQEYTQRRQYEAVIPHVRKQIEDAKTWPMFSEHEDEIAAALGADANMTLEGAYRKVVFPKLVAERNTMRQQVLKEVKQAPRASGVPSSATSGKPQASTGPRSLEDVINEQVAKLKNQ